MRYPQGGERRPWRFGLLTALAVLLVMAVLVSVAAAKPTATGATVKVGLITKDATNPFFVKMHAGANAAASKAGAQLIYAAGKDSSDNAGQITAQARAKGVLVIALDSPTDPTTAVDALFATNNFNAGVFIGKYARAATKGRKVTIAMLDEHAGSSVGALRHNGFLKGFGIKANNKQIACVANGGGQQTQSQPAMENCLQKNPNINVVYTINEPSAAGAWTALKNAGKKPSGVTIVSVDGGCAGVRNVKAGIIDATSQQYPLRMASLGVAAVVKFANGGAKASGYTDTGLNLIAKKPLKGVPSKSVKYGLANCWG